MFRSALSGGVLWHANRSHVHHVWMDGEWAGNINGRGSEEVQY